MILGLTGAIGAGKSAALDAFAAIGAEVCDADRLCHRCYADPVDPLVAELTSRWGGGILMEDGSVNRAAVAAIVFRDPVELEFLTSRIYPALNARIAEIAGRHRGRHDSFAVIEVPLLFECGMAAMFDATAALWADPLLRHRRLRERGLDDAEIARREKRQWSDQKKLETADFGIVNNGGLEPLIQQCTAIKNKLFRKVS